MRTNIEINDELMRAAMEATGASTKKEAVEAGLKALVGAKEREKVRYEARMKAREGLLGIVGKVDFDEDYVEMIRRRGIAG